MTEELKGGKIFAAISAVMAEVEPVAKDQSNPQQGWKFRGVDQTYCALQAVMAKHKIFTVPRIVAERTEERKSRSGSAIIYRILTIEYDFFAEDGSFVTARVIGEGQDSSDKASNKAMSVAHKYALLQTFCIPTQDPKDPELEVHDLEPKNESAGEGKSRDDKKAAAPASNEDKKQGQSKAEEKKPANKAKPEDNVKRILTAFGKMGVDRAKLEKFLNAKLVGTTEQVRLLRDIRDKIETGSMTVESVFGGQKPRPADELNEAYS